MVLLLFFFTSLGASAETTFGAQGRIEGQTEAIDIGFTIVGRVSRVLVAEGSPIIKDQIIAELECGEERANATEAQAVADSISNGYKRAKRGARIEERAAAAARIQAAKAELQNANTENARVQMLVTKGDLASHRDLDQTQLRIDVARSNLEVTQKDADHTNATLLPEEEARWVADVRGAQAHAEMAADHLRQCALLSPISGVVLRRHILPGTIITGPPFYPAFTVDDASKSKVRAEVDERNATMVHLGQIGSISLPLQPASIAQGKVVWISPVMGRTTVVGSSPSDKVDRDVREVLLDLGVLQRSLPIGLRVNVEFGQ